MKKEKKKSTFWKDFKAFIARGNIVDLAVAVVIGAAFTAIVNSLVNDIITPLISMLVDGNLSGLVIVLSDPVYEGDVLVKEAITLNYGNLIMAIITFLIDAIVIFTVVRFMRKAQARMREESEKIKDMFAKKQKELEEEEAAKNAVAAQPVVVTAPVPAKPTVEELLSEIRDLLKEDKQRGNIEPDPEPKNESK